MKKIKLILILTLLSSFQVILGSVVNPNIKPNLPLPPFVTNPETPNDDYKVPDILESGIDIEDKELRYLEKTYTVMMEAKVKVFIPLEVVSDIEIETSIIGNQIKDIPFEVELNRKPEKENYYSIKYSETAIDIDNDGKIDTYIHSPQFINEKISKDNYVRIYGENISKEGQHNKIVYVTVEIGQE